jgi:hypothetical protein
MRSLNWDWLHLVTPSPKSALGEASLRFLFVIAVVVFGGLILAAICGEPPAAVGGAVTSHPAASSISASTGS